MAIWIDWPDKGQSGVGLIGLSDGQLVYLYVAGASSRDDLSQVKSLRNLRNDEWQGPHRPNGVWSYADNCARA
jgi:hypothetical protein